MGAKSTIRITREQAIKGILEKLQNATNEEVERVAEVLEICGVLYNYSIVGLPEFSDLN